MTRSEQQSKRGQGGAGVPSVPESPDHPKCGTFLTAPRETSPAGVRTFVPGAAAKPNSSPLQAVLGQEREHIYHSTHRGPIYGDREFLLPT